MLCSHACRHLPASLSPTMLPLQMWIRLVSRLPVGFAVVLLAVAFPFFGTINAVLVSCPLARGSQSFLLCEYPDPAICKTSPCLTRFQSAGSLHNNAGNFHHSCIGLQLGLCLRSSPFGLSKAPHPGHVDPNLHTQLCHREPPAAHFWQCCFQAAWQHPSLHLC